MMSPPAIGSFRFDLRLEAPLQAQLFDEVEVPIPERVASSFFAVLRTIVEESPEALQKRVVDEQYREVFLRLVRNLVPDGKQLSEIEVRGVSGGVGQSAFLKPPTRTAIERAAVITIEE